jgi:hypothetical protein
LTTSIVILKTTIEEISQDPYKKAACGDTDCLKEGGVSKLRFKAADLKISLTAEYRLSIKKQLNEFIQTFNIDLLVTENVLTIPMHIPLGIALTELIAETQIPTIAHHHDFYWEW